MSKPWSIVTPVEYGQADQSGRRKTRWVRVGAAFPREDGGFSLAFDAHPVNGKALVMPPKEDGGGEGGF